MDVKNKSFSKDIKLENYIQVIENGMTPLVCDIILNEYIESNSWINWNLQSDIIFLTEDVIDTEEKKYIMDLIALSFLRLNFVVKIKKTYNILHPFNSGFNIIKQKVVSNQDTLEKLKYENNDNDIVSIIQLNDGYDGGEISFFNGNYRVKLKKGSIITFPLNILYEYEILPLIKGERYFLISFLNSSKSVTQLSQ